MKLRLSSKFATSARDSYGNRIIDVPLVDAIRAVRNLSHLGLKDAKDFVEEIFDKGSSFAKELTVRDDLSAPDVLAHIRSARAASMDVIEVGAEELEAFRTSTRKMITVALERDNIALARDLFNLYEKHFSR